ncbi:hypothetical protein HRbin36_01106 [bacterium HR36]|nr:hypothetical protein HRbin36_01106 [bacterium HR36]
MTSHQGVREDWREATVGGGTVGGGAGGGCAAVTPVPAPDAEAWPMPGLCRMGPPTWI